jgi:predicted DNA-binding transcriptional regulator AlpA
VKRQNPAARAAAKKKAELKASAASCALSPAANEAQEVAPAPAPDITQHQRANQQHIIEAGLAPDAAQHQHDRKRGHGARAPPAVRLLDKAEVCAIANVTFPTIWVWMRASPPKFPRALVVGGKSMWRSDEIDAWLAALPVRALKGDPPNPPEVV